MAKRLIEWACAGGAVWNPSLELRDGSHGRGVFTTAPIQKGDLLLRLPVSFQVRPAGRLQEMVAKRECSSLMALTLTVMHELNVRSPRLPFFEDLSTMPLPELPSLWSEEDLDVLPGTSLSGGKTPLQMMASIQDTFKEDVLPLMALMGEDYLPQSVRTKPLFAAALALSMSRALQGRLSFEVGGDSLWPCLRAGGPETAMQVCCYETKCNRCPCTSDLTQNVL